MNSKNFLLLVTTVFISLSSFAGNTFIFKKLKLKRIGIHMGVEKDLLMGNVMSDKYFNSLANNPELNEALENRIDANYWKHSGVCENPHLKLSLAFQLPKANRELQIGLINVFNRLDGIYYNKYQPEILDYAYFSYELYSSETAIEINYTASKELRLIKNVLHLNIYGMGGTNLGYQFNNELFVSGTEKIRDRQLGVRLQSTASINTNFDFDMEENIENYYDASNAINQRIYAGAGIGFVILNRLELGINGKFGYGYRYHFSNDFAATNIQSFDFSAKWLLK